MVHAYIPHHHKHTDRAGVATPQHTVCCAQERPSASCTNLVHAGPRADAVSSVVQQHFHRLRLAKPGQQLLPQQCAAVPGAPATTSQPLPGSAADMQLRQRQVCVLRAPAASVSHAGAEARGCAVCHPQQPARAQQELCEGPAGGCARAAAVPGGRHGAGTAAGDRPLQQPAQATTGGWAGREAGRLRAGQLVAQQAVQGGAWLRLVYVRQAAMELRAAVAAVHVTSHGGNTQVLDGAARATALSAEF